MKELTIEEWDALLCSTGYLPPRNEEELDFFCGMYDDYKSRMGNRHVDVEMILKGACRVATDSVSAKDTGDTMHEYSMAARNYDKLPKDVLDKMRKQHNSDEHDE